MSTNFGRAPAVFSREVDLTNTVSSVNTTEGAIAGVYNWGPVGQRVLVNSENSYAAVFGVPTNENAETWFSGANFLAYSDALYVVRAANTSGTSSDIANTVTSAVGAAANVANTILLQSIVANPNAYDDITFDSSVEFVAKYPGARGNSLRVAVCASPTAYLKPVPLIANADIDTTSAIVFTPGSNTATVTIVASATGNANTVTDAANTIVNEISTGDVLKVGNNTVGVQYMSVSSVAPPAITGNTATLVINLTAPLSLFEPVTSSLIVRNWEFYAAVDKAPGSSLYQSSTNNPNVVDELHIVVIDKDGEFTGIPNAILEVHSGLSRATDAKTDNGSSNFYKNVINQVSQYIWVGSGPAGVVTGPAAALTSPVQNKATYLNFRQGQNGLNESDVAIGDLAKAWDLFASADDVTISYLIQGKARGNTLANYLIGNIAEVRQDVIAVLSADKSAVVNAQNGEVDNLVNFRRSLNSTSYAELDCNFKYQYDKYNDVFRWVPLCGDIAGVMARSSAGTAPWMSPGGYSRGRIKNVVKLAWNPNQAQRDALYREDINPVYRVIGQGPLLMGDKTLIGKNSAFSRINVRQLFIMLRKNISQASADLLFEINDEFSQAQFRNMVDPMLRDVQGRRGITAYRVVCDETNNTPQVVDNNGFAGDVYVSPGRSINTIQLSFVATRTGVDFTEVINNF